MKPFSASCYSAVIALFLSFAALGQTPKMYYGDATATGVPYSKDPMVIAFKGHYLLYYSMHIPVSGDTGGMQGWQIGIAQSDDLQHWTKIGEMKPEASYEKQGLCAPGALVRDGKVHLFYQTYGNGPKDAICHATSTDGVHFDRDATNPIFHPTGSWTNGRAIDAEVIFFNKQYFLYFASRTPDGKVQLQGVATAPAGTNFSRSSWTQAADSSILKPQLTWEGDCVEGASVIARGKVLYMFYAGNYNNMPQQLGLAKSTDGLHWQRVSHQPFLPNGAKGSWNESESGHPGIFKDPKSGKTYLFYQGNNDKGRTWYLSNIEIGWGNNGPYIIAAK